MLQPEPEQVRLEEELNVKSFIEFLLQGVELRAVPALPVCESSKSA